MKWTVDFNPKFFIISSTHLSRARSGAQQENLIHSLATALRQLYSLGLRHYDGVSGDIDD